MLITYYHHKDGDRVQKYKVVAKRGSYDPYVIGIYSDYNTANEIANAILEYERFNRKFVQVSIYME